MKDKLKAILALLKSEEYFLTIANKEKNKYNLDISGPVKYKYFSNTDRLVFYLFIKNYINKFL